LPPGDRCDWPKCTAAPVIGWLGKLLCESHWTKVCRLTSNGRGGFLEAYTTLKVPKGLRANTVEPTEKRVSDYGDLPDPDEFDYEPP